MQKLNSLALSAVLVSLLSAFGCGGGTMSKSANTNSSGNTSQTTQTTSTSTSNNPPSNGTTPSSSSSLANVFSDVQAGGGWNGYGLLPPTYGICDTCAPTGPSASWSTTQNISSPS